MVMVGTAPVERIIQSEGDHPIRPWILVWGELSGWLQGLMVSMPALRQQCFIASTPLHVALLQYNPHAGRMTGLSTKEQHLGVVSVQGKCHL